MGFEESDERGSRISYTAILQDISSKLDVINKGRHTLYCRGPSST